MVPVVTRSLRVARALVAVSALCAPVVSALLLTVDGHPAWPTLVALAAGVVARVAAPASTAPLLVGVGLAPLWQAGSAVVAGSSDLQVLMPWLAALAGWIAWPVGPAWRVTGIWQVGVVSWALVMAVGWPITALRELDFTLQTIGTSTPNGSFGLTPHLSGAFVALTAETQFVALLVFDWAWGAPSALRRRAWWALAPGVAAACLVAVWQQAVDPSLLSREPWIGLDRAAGLFFDANAMGALAALIGAALAGPGMCPARVPRVLWTVGWAALSVAGVMASGSRTALAALAVSMAAAGLVTLRGWRRLATVVAMGALVMMTARFAGARGEITSGNAAGRLAGTARRVVEGGAAELWDVAWRRDGYGPASMAIIVEHPWVGVGPGAFGNVVTDYGQQALGLRLPPDNAQNWWRQQLADLGLVGGAGALLCSVLALVAVLRSWHRPGDLAALRTAPLVALGLMALVSPATQHPVLQVLAGLLVAHAVVPSEHSGGGRLPAATSRPVVALVWAIALVYGASLAVEGWTAFRPPDRASRFHFGYNYGVSAPVQTPFGEGRWSALRSVVVFRPEGRVLVARVVLPHEDLERSPVVVTLSDGHRVWCRHQGRDHTPFECRMPAPTGRWMFVQVDVSRAWRTENSAEQAALVAVRYEP